MAAFYFIKKPVYISFRAPQVVQHGQLNNHYNHFDFVICVVLFVLLGLDLIWIAVCNLFQLYETNPFVLLLLLLLFYKPACIP